MEVTGTLTPAALPTVRLSFDGNAIQVDMSGRLAGLAGEWSWDELIVWLGEAWERGQQVAGAVTTLKAAGFDPGAQAEAIERTGYADWRRVPAALPLAEGAAGERGSAPAALDSAAAASDSVPGAGEALSPGESLDARIARLTEEGKLLPPSGPLRKRYKGVAAEQLAAAIEAAVSAAGGRITRTALRAAVAAPGPSLDYRLKQLVAEGRLTVTRGPGKHCTYQEVGLADAPPAATPAAVLAAEATLAQVLPHCHGKRFLMLGGTPKPFARSAMEQALGLAELRWPDHGTGTFKAAGDFDRRVNEIGQADVDLVLVNRFNRKESRHYQHLARSAGKPVVILPGGYGVNQVAEQLKTQWVEPLVAGQRGASA